MNIETREIRDVKDLSDEEKASGKWIPVAKKYVKRQPITDADFARIVKADAKRSRKAQLRNSHGRASRPEESGTP